MKGPLKSAFLTDDIADLMNFDMFPFGQAMWNTPQCGEMDTTSYMWGVFWEGYDANARLCFDTMCGANSSEFFGQRPAECFDEAMGPYCQHGGAECAVNSIQACAKKQSNNSYMEFGPFAVCFEENYEVIRSPEGATAESTFKENRSLAEVAINATMKKCVKGTALAEQELLSCFYGNEVGELAEVAAATIPHLYVPFVRVQQCNGSWTILELGNTPADNLLVDAVCDATCSNTAAAQKCTKTLAVTI